RFRAGDVFTSMMSCSADGAAHQEAMALTRAFRRDSLREAVRFFTTPLLTLRSSSGCAALRAACAAVLSPVAIATSTFFTELRTLLRRERFTAVRFLVWRARFSADLC